MSAVSQPVQRATDVRRVLVSGLKLGILTAVAVVLVFQGSTFVPEGLARTLFQALVVFTTGCLVAFLPAAWMEARDVEGMAGAAFVGMVATVAFTFIDIIVLRPLSVYPWTWDALGGGSGWWYLPVWWMLGTLVSWQGGIVTARMAVRDRASLTTLVLGLGAGTAALTAIGALTGLLPFGPVLVGGALVVSVTAWSVSSLALASGA